MFSIYSLHFLCLVMENKTLLFTHTHIPHTHTRLGTSKLKKKKKNPGERLIKSSSLAAKVIGLGKATEEVKQHGMLSFQTHKRTRKHGLLIAQSRQICGVIGKIILTMKLEDLSPISL